MAVSAKDSPNLALLYGKLWLEERQEMRKQVRKLDPELQKSFVRTSQNNQALAELLISQNHLDSAVRVLDLYRAQQYFDFDPSDRASVESIRLSKREQYFLDLQTAFSIESKKVRTQIDELKRDLVDREPTEKDRQKLQALNSELQTVANKFLSDVKEAESQFMKPDDEAWMTTYSKGLSEFLRASSPNAVVIYTLIGAEELYLIMIDKDGIQPVSVPIKGTLLNDKAKEFAAIIQNVDSKTQKPNLDVTDQAKELYNIIFRPIEKKLPKNTNTILWNLDGNLRYVPINALHDGNDYLVRRQLNNVLMTRTELKPSTDPRNWRASGFAVTRETKQIRNVEDHPDFPALIGSKLEMTYIFNSGSRKNVIFEGQPLLDSAFTREAMLQELRKELPVVHISSHFKVRPGDLSLSFLVLGDDSAFSLADMKKAAESFPNGMLFSKVDLLTLSACDTGVSEPDSDGREDR